MKKSMLIILAVVLGVCVFYGIRYIENPVATQIAVSEVYENKIDTSGYLVFTEQVYSAPVEGSVYHYIQEGTRVGKGKALSTVYTSEVSKETLQELNSINQKIHELESEGMGKGYISGGSNNQEVIENLKNSIISAKNGGEPSKIELYKSRINAVITGDSTNHETASLEELFTKKNSIESGIRNYKNDIYSGISGVFSKNVDSLEEVLTPKNILSYTLKDYKAIENKTAKEKTATAYGEPVSKVVNNHEWYVMATVSAEEAKLIKTGKKVEVRYSYLPGVTAKGKIEYISTEDAGAERNVVVIKFEEYREGVYSLRHSNIEIILESYEGYRIPVSALRVTEEGTKGVLVKTEGAQVIKPCNVVYSDTVNQTVIITPVSGAKNLLREYDNIVIGEK